MAKKQNIATGEQVVANSALNNAELGNAPVAQRPDKKNNKKKSGKPGFFARIGKNLKEMFSEMKKVSWPTAKKTFASLGTVLVVVLVFLLLVIGFDSLWAWLLKLLLQQA